jgi:hypothetical protein
MSRYLLGFQEKEVVEELETQETVASTPQSNGSRYGTRFKKPAPQVLGIDAGVRQGQVEQVARLVDEITNLLERQDLTEGHREVLLNILIKVRDLLVTLAETSDHI